MFGPSPNGLFSLRQLKQVALRPDSGNPVTQAAVARQEVLVQDAPEEFNDPLLFTLTTNLLVRPTSNFTVNRQMIARHLLSDPTDPFN